MKHLFDHKPFIIQAPMAGVSTSNMAIAASENGILGSLAAGYLSAEDLQKDIQAVEAATHQPYAINVFVSDSTLPSYDQCTLERMQEKLNQYRKELQLPEKALEAPVIDPYQTYLSHLDLALKSKARVFSFTFGVPDSSMISTFKKSGKLVIGTATHVEEAIKLQTAGCDAIVAQGIEAGGHRGTFLENVHDTSFSTEALVKFLSQQLTIPIIAAGGVQSSQDIIHMISAGASGVQIGTVFIPCLESAASPIHKKAVVEKDSGKSTRLTKAFSGRYARGILNRMMEELEDFSTLPYPLQHYLTIDIRKAAALQDNKNFCALWSGMNAGQSDNNFLNVPMKKVIEALRSKIAQ